MKYTESKTTGIFYHSDTTPEMVKILDSIREKKTRCRFHWGDVKTGKDWEDLYDVKGRIGKSTGSIKIPLLMYSERSYGGVALLDNCIVKITETKGGRVIYQHPSYHK